MQFKSGLFGIVLLAMLVQAVPAPPKPSSSGSASGASSGSITTSASGPPSGGPKNNTKRATQSQSDAQWGLARIAQQKALTTVGDDEDGPDEIPKRAASLDWKFPYDDSWGEGVIMYIVDSGVRKTHSELAGRVEDGWVLPRLSGAATEDVCQHGTAVASLAAGKTLGVARKATIVPVRIADKDGCSRIATTTEDVVAGVNWAVSDFQKDTRCDAKAGIINISWEVYQTPASQKAFEDAIAAGMHVVVSAGNYDQNQCFGEGSESQNTRVKPVGQIIVGNLDWTDTRFSLLENSLGSNYGTCVTIWAPGTSMNVACPKDDNAIEHGGCDQSGTSFSAPIVVGTIAAYVSAEGNKPPSEMKAFLLSKSVSGGKDLKNSPDVLVQTPILSTTPQ
ncbi:peptidase S8/S53 domain-containing protein [Mycena rebaudengoi]|nr:peptidase S8/S53 domain-containing protein [Mycena rebaudengoi]